MTVHIQLREVQTTNFAEPEEAAGAGIRKNYGHLHPGWFTSDISISAICLEKNTPESTASGLSWAW